jgi:hypothetical protein
VAAGADDHILNSGVHHFIVAAFHHGSSNGGFLNPGKAQFFQGPGHGGQGKSSAGFFVDVIRGERRGKADINAAAARDKALRRLYIVSDFLGLLGADYKTVSAQNTFFGNNFRVAMLKGDGFYRAMADAFVTVFAVHRFKIKIIVHN